MKQFYKPMYKSNMCFIVFTKLYASNLTTLPSGLPTTFGDHKPRAKALNCGGGGGINGACTMGIDAAEGA